jgi:membrane-associated phospholipid phosphatase
MSVWAWKLWNGCVTTLDDIPRSQNVQFVINVGNWIVPCRPSLWNRSSIMRWMCIIDSKFRSQEVWSVWWRMKYQISFSVLTLGFNYMYCAQNRAVHNFKVLMSKDHLNLPIQAWLPLDVSLRSSEIRYSVHVGLWNLRAASRNFPSSVSAAKRALFI